MSTYDAGRIEATADVDRTPFSQGLQLAIREGEEFAAHRFTAAADIDARPAEQAFDRLKAKGENFSKQKFSAKVDVDVSGNVRFDALIRKAEEYNGNVYRAKVVLDSEIAFLKLDDLEARLAALTAGVHTIRVRYDSSGLPNLPRTMPGRAPGAGSSSSDGQFSPLGTALVAGVPALLPLLPLAAGLAGAFVAVGASGMLAFKGITSEMKEGTAQGQEYSRGVKIVEGDLTTLEATAARGVLSPFSRDVQFINQQMPLLNAEVGKYSAMAGNTVDQLFRGSISALHVLDPLLTQVSGWVYSIAAGFNRWASDGGLQRWEERAIQVLPEVERDLGDIVTAIGRVLAAAGPFGMGTFRALDLIAKGLDGLPLPVLKTLVTLAGTGYLAFQAWRGLEPVVGVVGKLTTAIKAYEVEQLVAAGVTKAAATEQATLSGGLRVMAMQYGTLGLAIGLGAAATLGIIAITQSMTKNSVATAASASDAAKELLHMAQSGEVLQDTMGKLGVSSKNLDSVLENAFKESNWTKIKDFDFGLGHLGLHPMVNTATNDAKNFFKSVDDGLAQMIADGQQASAQSAFKIIADQAAAQGVTVDQLLTKLPKYKSALDAINASANGPIVGLNGVLMATSGSLDTLAGKYGLNSAAAQNYVGILGITSDMVKNSIVPQSVLAQALDVTSAAERQGTQTTAEYLAAVQTFAQSAGSAADRAALIGATLKAANGDALAYAGTMVLAASANQQLVSGFDKQQRSAINLKSGVIDYRNAAAGPLLSALQNLQTAAMNAAGATYQHEVATRGAKLASDDAVTAYYSQTHGALMDEAKQLGLTKDQAKRLADQYFSLPSDIRTKIEAIGTDPVLKVLDQIGQQLSLLTHRPWVSQFGITGADGALATIAAIQSRLVKLNGQTAYVQVNERTVGGANSGGRQVLAYGGLIRAYGYGGADVANGHQPAIYAARPGAVRVFAEPETGGEAYIPLAADNRRPRARAIAADTVRMLGGVAYFDDGGFSFVNVHGPTASKASGGSRGAASGNVATVFNNRVYSSLQAAEAAKGTLGDSLARALAGELQSLGSLANATEAQVTSAMNKILATVRQAVSTGFGPSRLVASLQVESRQLEAEVARRTQLAAKLAADTKAVADTRAAMASAAAQTSQNIMGGFDFGTAGNGYAFGISSTLDQRVQDAAKFRDLVTRARGLGLSDAALQQIIGEGPQTAGANLQAIVTAGTADRSYITHLDQQYATLKSIADQLGQQEAQAQYGAQLLAQQTAVARDTAAVRAESRAIHDTLVAMSRQLAGLDRTIKAETQEAHRLATASARQHI